MFELIAGIFGLIVGIALSYVAAIGLGILFGIFWRIFKHVGGVGQKTPPLKFPIIDRKQ